MTPLRWVVLAIGAFLAGMAGAVIAIVAALPTREGWGDE